MAPVVSVVMPAYNAEKTVKRAIASVIAQSFRDWELLVVNDCSADKTVETVKEFSAKDERIKLFENSKNLGVSETRNFAIRKAEGEYIAFLDSDDYWREDKLEKQLTVLQNDENCGICFTASEFVSEEGILSAHILKAPEKVTYEMLLRQNVISCSSVLVRKKDLIENPMPKDKMLHEDYAVWLSMLKKYPYAVGIDEPMLTYQISAQSKSGNKFKAAKMQWNTYMHCKIPKSKAVGFFVSYALRSLKKYNSIHKNMEKGASDEQYP